MGSDRSPAFLFYPKDWRGSRKVQAMSFATRGMYFELLLEQWETGAVPASPAACAALFDGGTRAWTRAWPQLSKCFVARARDGLLVNPKLEAVRRERQRFLKSQREHGLRGARRRWKKDGKPIGSPSGRYATPMPNDSNDLSTTDLSTTDLSTPSIPRDAVRAAFDAFWTVYPKKVGKDAAWNAWRKRRPTPELSRQILEALNWQRTQDNWLRDGGRFVPNPATWINQGRWQDEPVATPRLNEQSIRLARTGQEWVKS